MSVKKVTVRIDEADLQQVYDRFPYSTQQATIQAALRSAVVNQDNARAHINNLKLKNKIDSYRITLATSVLISVILSLTCIALALK